MTTASRAKHKFCRRIGQCLWNDPKCPSAKRPYPAGPHGKGRRSKLSTYGELLLEKQKLRLHYAISEKQLQIAYAKAKQGEGQAHEKLFRSLEQRLDALVFRAGFAPTIFAAKQYVSHGHIYVDGKRVDRASYKVKEGSVISIKADKSPAVAETAKKSNCVVPPYMEVDREALTATLTRVPQVEEIPVSVQIMSVIEYYAR
ncbi:30S ribosomal protein S4 [Victivallis sp. Marseille-Q1083]|uniref:30S ribosomal protein S4 n=1 Tax=Victivallis sp. Marseille-Q1083 TaxID=2717288 RepID=UPI00158C3CBE|nr:30S ribosomal protein S4 [Victivallis sp. Marseille-Q1083]